MFRNPLTDSIVVLVVLLLFFGPKRLPLLGRSLGEGMKQFKDSITGHSKDEDEEQPAAISEGTQPTATSAPPAEPATAPAEAPGAPAATPANPEPQSAGVASSEQRP
jgi:sec-independent protein translocase protein TatA